MKRLTQWAVLAACMAIGPGTVFAQRFDTAVPMQDKGVATYYVAGEIASYGKVEFMVDTGSGYTTINEQTLLYLLKRDEAKFMGMMDAMLANGERTMVPRYLISAINIGGECWVNDVEAAVFPGKTRQILGLSALKTVSPFIFSFDPPELVLSHCAPVHQTKLDLE